MSALNLTNQFLIAMPRLQDPNFAKTVTYVCAHSEDGAMGIVINRPLDLGLGEVLQQMDLSAVDPTINSLPVFQGGPVHPDRGFIIFRPLSKWDSTITVSADCGVATSRDILEAIAQGRGPEQALVALGYAGWGAGQLEREMGENAWLNVAADQNIIFSLKPEKRWEYAVALLGVDVGRLSSDVGHA